MRVNKLVFSLILGVFLFTSLNIVSAAVTLNTPAAGVTVAGQSAWYASVTTHNDTNFTCIFTALSISTANNSSTTLATIKNDTDGVYLFRQ